MNLKAEEGIEDEVGGLEVEEEDGGDLPTTMAKCRGMKLINTDRAMEDLVADLNSQGRNNKEFRWATRTDLGIYVAYLSKS